MRTAREYRQTAWDRLAGRYWWMVLAALIAIVLGGVGASSVVRINVNVDDVKGFHQCLEQWPHAVDWLRLLGLTMASVLTVYGTAVFIIGGAVELGYNRFNLRFYQFNERPDLSLLFSRFSIFGRALWLRVLIALKVLLWSLLLVVPGIIAAYRYAMATYLVAENPDITASDAIRQSADMMRGRKWNLFCLHLSFIGWYLLAALTMGVGMVFLQPYVKAAETAFYLDLSGRLGPPPYQSPVAAQGPADAGDGPQRI